MARAPRRSEPGEWFHVMNRALPEENLFEAGRDRQRFLELVAAATDTGVEVHAYSLMSTHFHLLLRAPSEVVSRFMYLLSSGYARHAHRQLGRVGPVFRGRFTSRTLRSYGHIAAVARYIHLNAVDVVGEAELNAYPWSSWRAYLGLSEAPPWLTTHVVRDFAA